MWGLEQSRTLGPWKCPKKKWMEVTVLWIWIIRFLFWTLSWIECLDPNTFVFMLRYTPFEFVYSLFTLDIVGFKVQNSSIKFTFLSELLSTSKWVLTHNAQISRSLVERRRQEIATKGLLLKRSQCWISWRPNVPNLGSIGVLPER